MKNVRHTHARKGRKKPVIAAAAAIVSVAVLLGGAFAWTDFTQSRTNKFRGTTDADVTLHDQFDGVNKDVFVENSGDSVIYVRVRLDEFMQVGGTVFATGADIKDKTTWTPHTYDNGDITDCGNAVIDKFHDYYKWDMSGRDRDYKGGTPGMVYGTLGADGKVDESGPKHTAAYTEPITMSEFLRLESQAYGAMGPADQALWDNVKAGCWILDDTDTASNGGGWAYWSQPLEPGTATNLLLDEVTLKQDAEEDWVYRIDVKLQAVTANDFGKWNDTASTIGYKTTAGVQVLINNVLKAS